MRAKALIGVASAFTLGLGGTPASAEILKNFRMGGQIDVQATSSYNVSDFVTSQQVNGAVVTANNDRMGDAQTRVLLHMDWDVLDDVHSRITMRKNDRTWGNAGGPNPNYPVGTVSQPLQANAAGNVLGNIFLDEAWLKIDKVVGQFDLTLGRQFFGESGDVVVYYGPSDKAYYGLPVAAIDGARVDWLPWEWLSVTGLVSKQKGSVIGTLAPPDVDVRGLNFRANFNENVAMGLYGWNKVTHATGALGVPPSNAGPATGLNDHLFLVGYRLKLSGWGFWLKGEYDKNFGENRGNFVDANHALASNYNGWAALGDVGWKGESDSAGMLAIWGQGAIGSGRQNTRDNTNDGFAAINPDYRPGSIYGRFTMSSAFAGLANGLPQDADTTITPSGTLANRVILGTGIKMSPGFANKAVLGVSWWDYRLHRFNQKPGDLSAAYRGNRHIGAELDVDLTWAHSENVAFSTGWGTFQPGGLIYEIVDNKLPGGTLGRGVNPVQLVYFDTRVRF